MRKIIATLLIIMLFSLCACSVSPSFVESNNIETLKGWSFQYNSGTKDYSLFFGLLNNHEKYISAEVNVDIRIVNDKDEEVYSATKTVTTENFGSYESKAAGEHYLANVRIAASEIKEGKSGSGTVYLTVYKDDTVRFDEVNCSALYCLPIADIQVTAEDLPAELQVKDYDGSTKSIIKVTDMEYTYEKEYLSQLKIRISGEKTYGNSSNYDIIVCKIYDSGGYLIESSMVYLDSLSEGDKFRDDSVVIYDIIPGETYTVQFEEYTW